MLAGRLAGWVGGWVGGWLADFLAGDDYVCMCACHQFGLLVMKDCGVCCYYLIVYLSKVPWALQRLLPWARQPSFSAQAASWSWIHTARRDSTLFVPSRRCGPGHSTSGTGKPCQTVLLITSRLFMPSQPLSPIACVMQAVAHATHAVPYGLCHAFCGPTHAGYDVRRQHYHGRLMPKGLMRLCFVAHRPSSNDSGRA